MKTAVIIPARYSSTRFPGKPLAPIAGRPMIEWVYSRARKASLVDEVLVATDDERIFSAVEAFGGNAVMTSPECASGTDRVAEAAATTGAELVLNVQGDEPLIDPEALDGLVRLFCEDGGLQFGTLVAPLTDECDLSNPNVVKVVTGTGMECLYFSRSPVPFLRDSRFEEFDFYKHIGVYGYRRDFLFKFARMPRGRLEAAESLEQLRALENGFRMRAALARGWIGAAVDVPGDLEKVEELIKKGEFPPPCK